VSFVTVCVNATVASGNLGKQYDDDTESLGQWAQYLCIVTFDSDPCVRL
jgi:hypothetical protein